MSFRTYNTYLIGKPIVKGIYSENTDLNNTIRAEDFELFIANTLDPLTETKLDVKVIDDNPYWWTEPFEIWSEGEYILHWVNHPAKINFKQTFMVMKDLNIENDTKLRG